ncbi:MAG: hypothetical protein WA908_12780 [Pontixanthobacter sp.]
MISADNRQWASGRLVFETARQRPWMVSHGCTPTAIVLKDRFRVLFAPRNEAGRSIPSYVDLALDDPSRTLAIGDRPIMELGELGTFDDGGIMPCSIVRADDGRIFLYYVGWNASVTVPYRNAIGVAISEDDGKTFNRIFPGAIVDRNRAEPYFTASPCVFRTKSKWHLWYASTIRFEVYDGRAEPVYILRHATSSNGLDWSREETPVLPQRHPSEAQAKPSVIDAEDGLLKMWYCYRDNEDFRDGAGSYRLGLAHSTDDGLSWTRIDGEVGPPRGDYDGAMQCYPNVVKCDEKLHLFYNGDSFGKMGILYSSCAVE